MPVNGLFGLKESNLVKKDQSKRRGYEVGPLFLPWHLIKSFNTPGPKFQS